MSEKKKSITVIISLCLIFLFLNVFEICFISKLITTLGDRFDNVIHQQLNERVETLCEKIDVLIENSNEFNLGDISTITLNDGLAENNFENSKNNLKEYRVILSALIDYLKQEDAVFDIDIYKNLYNRVLNDESYDVYDDGLQKEIERIYELNDLILQAVTINSNTESLKSDNFSNLADLLNVIGYLGTQERESRVDYKTGFSSMGYILVDNFFNDVGEKIRILEKGFVERVDNEIPMPNISQYLIEDKIGRDSYQEELATYYSKLFELARSCPFEAPFFTKFVQDKQSAIETNIKTLNEHRLKNYQIKAFDAIKDVHEIDKKTSENDRKSRYVEMLRYDRSLLVTELQILYENEVNSLKENNQLFNEVLMVAVSSMHKIEDF